MSASQSHLRISHTKPLSPLLTLPLELQLLIIPSLSYPDALALKHTHTHFYDLIDTSVSLKVVWLLERKERGLELPQKKCAMKTDAAFCGGNGEVRAIMERRRAHGECTAGERGCEVVVGSTCGAGKGVNRRRVVQRFWSNTVGKSGEFLTNWITGLLVMSFLVNFCFVVRWYFSNTQ